MEKSSFPDKKELREFSTSEPGFQQMLKELSYSGNKEKEKLFNT